MSWYWVKAVEKCHLTLWKNMIARGALVKPCYHAHSSNFILQVLLEADISLHLQEQKLTTSHLKKKLEVRAETAQCSQLVKINLRLSLLCWTQLQCLCAHLVYMFLLLHLGIVVREVEDGKLKGYQDKL